MQESRTFLCKSCAQGFSRQDHLARHELSHQQAKHYCRFPSCGMAFHRPDVLKRHQRVHQPDPTKKRRRRRRDVMPALRPATLEVHRQQKPEMATMIDSSATNTSQASDLAKSATLTALLQPLEFCYTHYLQTCVPRWPFIHHSYLQRHTLSTEKYLAMAALGGSSIPEYHASSAKFFDTVVQSLFTTSDRHWIIVPRHRTLGSSCSVDVEALELLQTHILLLEYASWKRDTNTQRWVADLIFTHAFEKIPQLITIAKGYRSGSWRDWVYEEQILRAIWTFYCTAQKASSKYQLNPSILELLKDLKLPCSDVAFNASSGQLYDGTLIEPLRSGVDVIGISLQHALDCVLSTHEDKTLLTSISPVGRHIVLVALLDIHYNEAAHPSFAPILTDKARAFVNILQNLEVLWHQPLGELFFANPPRSLEFQNCLLLNHIRIRAIIRLSEDLSNDERKAHVCRAASIANEVFAPAIEHGAINLNSKAAWFTDAASKRYVVRMARVMVDWATQLQETDLGTAEMSGRDHKVLYEVISSLLNQKDQIFASGVRQNDLKQFTEALKSAWSDILRCPPVRWYRHHEWAH